MVIVVGANDFDASLAGDPGCADLDCWADTRAMLAATLDQVLTRISALVPARAPVVLTGYLDGAAGAALGPTYVANSDALTRSVNSVLASTAAAHSDRYADGYAALQGDRREAGALLASDGDQPDAAAHLALAAAVQRALSA